ncbi:hypothetical protein BDW62DRAFT_208480 [Aspergillus aurantiobrunneus]
MGISAGQVTTPDEGQVARLYAPSESLEAFFVGARSLIERDSESMQEVIHYMFKEHGLRYIQQLVEREFGLLPSCTRCDVFRAQMSPFLVTISHPKVLSSLVAEHPLGIIYNFIYGIGGSRAVHLIASICSVLESLGTDDDTRAKWLEDSLAVFCRIMFVNTTAFIQTGLGEQVFKLQNIMTAMDEGNMTSKLHVSRRYLAQLLSRIENGVQMPTPSQAEAVKMVQITTFVPHQEPPGGRHDNDYEDFALVQIMPTLDEILSARAEYLPQHDPSRWHVGGLEGLLDWNFRLLRENSIGLLRDAVYQLLNDPSGGIPRANLYRGARILKFHLHWNFGFQFQVGFSQPVHLRRMRPPEREAWWSTTKRLQPGALVCLIINGNYPAFCKVAHGPYEQPYGNGKRSRKDKESAKFASLWKEGTFITLTTVGPDERTVRSILDNYGSPNASFLMAEFPGVLLPSLELEPTLRALQRIKKASHLRFENLLISFSTDEQINVPPPLYTLRNGDFFVHLDKPLDTENLSKALVNNLQHCIGLIQGPPGTGKSFTGVALIKVLLANKHENGANIGPILCASYTNHALDQLLVSLLDRKITTNILYGCNLRNFAKIATKTREGSSMGKRLRSELLTQIPATKLPPYLHQYYLDHFRQLFCQDEAGRDPSHLRNPGAVIKAWLTSGIDLTLVNVHNMTRAKRKVVHQQWMEALSDNIRCEAIQLVSTHPEIKHDWDSIRSEVDLRCLTDADIIGMLQKLQAKVVICEEAGEVLEAHLLTALLPSVEHAILVGDHLQLQNHNGGDRYLLGVSLFERLVMPRSAFGSGLPYSMLEIQRRMHPEIAELDASCVSEYPKIPGMKKRLFWLDHRYYEEGTRDDLDVVTTSHWNNYEVEMTVALVNHLINQGAYKSGDIAILTPYLGQLYHLQQKLRHLFAICISERDQEDLEKADLGLEEGSNSKPVIKCELLEAVRVATIDNFQGEEAKIVVVSLVRSNPQNRCGFLSTSNRINVLLSRAQHGMYILRNSETSLHIPMWAQVVQILKEGDNFGYNLELECPRHPETHMMVSEPSHFLQFSPEGGCNLRCTKRLKCGHACEHRCHFDILHDAVLCRQPCPKLQKGCTHPCPELCGNPCPFNYQDPTKSLCRELVKKVVPRCKHEVFEPCHLAVSAATYKCETTYGVQLPCGHTCSRKCHECNKIDGVDHGRFRQQCDRSYSTCRHICKTACHGKEPCPACETPCEICCNHSRCTLKCYQPCTPCSEEKRLSVCPHSQCPPAKFCQLCAAEGIKNHVVDFIFGQICGHFLTMKSMDAQMDIEKCYTLNDDRKPIATKSSPEPFSKEDIKNCALCRGHLRDISRYGRLVRQALLDGSTKKFILCLNREHMSLAEKMIRIPLPSIIQINGPRSDQVHAMNRAIGSLSIVRWGEVLKLREQIETYCCPASPDEQPFIRVLKLIENARRRQNISASKFDCSSSLQVKGILLAMALSLRLDIALLTDFLRMKGRTHVKITINLEENRKECEYFINTARDSKRTPLEAEGHLFLAQLHALERYYCISANASRTHLEKGRAALEGARSIVNRFPEQTRGLASEIDAVENMFLSTFYAIVTNTERLAVVQAMASESRGTGHWYYCQNGHPFTIGECGGAMQESLCPECGAPVGGRQHRVLEGVTRADDLEESVVW